MNAKAYLIFALLFFAQLASFGQWHHTNPYADEFDDIQMVDYLNGYAVGRDNGIGTCSTFISALFRTSDGGETWTRNALDASHEITSIHFINRTTGWASCYYGKVLKTVDCGQTWTAYATGIPQDINDVFFVNSSTGFAVADDGHIRKSLNGGSSWAFNYDQGDATLRKVEFFNETFGFAVGSSGAILRTSDAGANWEAYDTGNSASFFDIEFISEQNIFLSSYNAIYHSTDGGDSWEAIDLPDTYAIRSIEFTSPEIGYLGGELGQLFKTTDGGSTWFDLDFPYDETIYTLDFLDMNTGYMSTNRAGIFFTEDAGLTWYCQHTGVKGVYSFGSTADLADVHFLSADTGIVVGGTGNICMTYNAGLTWSRKISPTTSDLTSVQWIDEQRLVAAGENGTFIISSDVGETWEVVATPTSQYIQGIWFEPQGETGYLLGLSDTLLKTIDLGANWEVQEPMSGEYYRDFDFLNTDYGVVIGADFVMRTLDGGATWTEQPYYEEISSLRCIDIVNDSLSYIGNNNVLVSRNGGEYWDSISVATNLFCDDISFLNDSMGYIVTGAAVRLSTDSAQLWGSVTTPCLNNSWSLDAVDPIDIHHAIAVGDSPMRRLWSGTPTISTHVSGDAYCPGEKMNVSYRYDGTYDNANTYVAQLSDAFGSFDSPMDIGSYFSPFIQNHPSGVISCSIPPGIPAGSGYRIRIIGQDPEVIGDDNGFDINMTATLQPSIELIVVAESCDASPVTFETVIGQAGVMQSYSWTVNGIAIAHNGAVWSTDSLMPGDQVQVLLGVQSACTSAEVSSSVETVPFPSNPSMTLSDDMTINQGESIMLMANGLSIYLWEPPSFLTAVDIPNPVSTPDSTITYYVTGFDDSGCSVSDSVTITVIPLVDDLTEFSSMMTISPNPASDRLILSLEKQLQGELQICDALGHRLMEQKVSGTEFVLDISSLSPGPYFIILSSDVRRYTRQIIIKR